MKKLRNIILIVVFLATPAIWMTYNVLTSVKYECKVCMEFSGKENCGKAVGGDKSSCVQTAKDNACALIVSGMAASIQCNQSDPLSVEIK